MSDELTLDWRSICGRSDRYPPAAFEFVRQGLGYAVGDVHGQAEGVDPHDESRHVSGQQLCNGLRNYAIKRYGRLARMVLESWNVRTTEDFGRIVFAMVDAGLLRKTEDDSIEDFQDVFEFNEAFDAIGVAGTTD